VSGRVRIRFNSIRRLCTFRNHEGGGNNQTDESESSDEILHREDPRAALFGRLMKESSAPNKESPILEIWNGITNVVLRTENSADLGQRSLLGQSGYSSGKSIVKGGPRWLVSDTKCSALNAGGLTGRTRQTGPANPARRILQMLSGKFMGRI
jgi:hypothetical protein